MKILSCLTFFLELRLKSVKKGKPESTCEMTIMKTM